MRSRRPLLLSLFLCATLAACAASRAAPDGRAAADAPGTRPAKVRRSPNHLAAEDINPARFGTAFDVVQALRPQWLRVRGPSSITLTTAVRVYQDGMLLGGVDMLKRISSTSVQSLEFVAGVDATQRWGTDHGDGVILVRTTGARR